MQTIRSTPLSNSSVRSAALLIAVVLSVCLLVMPVMANPPSDVVVTYDKETSQLTVTITHQVPDPATHFIKNIKINQNGRIVVDKEYTSQPTKDRFSYTYTLPVNAGDTIRANAICSLAGSTEGILTLPTPSSTASPTIPPTTVAPVPTTQKSPMGLIPVLGAGFLAAFTLVLHRK